MDRLTIHEALVFSLTVFVLCTESCPCMQRTITASYICFLPLCTIKLSSISKNPSSSSVFTSSHGFGSKALHFHGPSRGHRRARGAGRVNSRRATDWRQAPPPCSGTSTRGAHVRHRAAVQGARRALTRTSRRRRRGPVIAWRWRDGVRCHPARHGVVDSAGGHRHDRAFIAH
jgi:hypothetical protein